MTDSEQSARRSSFDNVADIDHAIRPGYPPPLFATLFELLPDHPRVLEVGPGTGQATRDLLAHWCTLTSCDDPASSNRPGHQ